MNTNTVKFLPKHNQQNIISWNVTADAVCVEESSLVHRISIQIQKRLNIKALQL